MAFFVEGVNTLSMIMSVIGAGFCAWGGFQVFEGYSSDNAASKAQGIKQFIAGAGIIVIALTLVPMLGTMLTP